jgi:hypothetical protein
MSNSLNWKGHRERQQRIAETSRAHEESMAIRAEANRSQADSDLRWLEDMLHHPGLEQYENREFAESALLASIEWIKANGRPLFSTYRRRFVDLQRVLFIIERKGPMPKPTEPSPRRRPGFNVKTMSIAAAYARERREAYEASKPAWMKDPALLPKRPPGR